jgi:hypothetical protein
MSCLPSLPQASVDQPTTPHSPTPATHTPPTLPSTSNPYKDRSTYKIRNKEDINHINITYTTSNLRTSQNPHVSQKPKIYINTPTPHARPPEAIHAKTRPSKASRIEEKHSLGQTYTRTSLQSHKRTNTDDQPGEA